MQEHWIMLHCGHNYAPAIFASIFLKTINFLQIGNVPYNSFLFFGTAPSLYKRGSLIYAHDLLSESTFIKRNKQSHRLLLISSCTVCICMVALCSFLRSGHSKYQYTCSTVYKIISRGLLIKCFDKLSRTHIHVNSKLT